MEKAENLTILTDLKLLESFKTQLKLNKKQSGWIELLGNFNFNLIYYPSYKLIQADALLHIYIQQLKLKDELNPDWPM